MDKWLDRITIAVCTAALLYFAWHYAHYLLR